MPNVPWVYFGGVVRPRQLKVGEGYVLPATPEPNSPNMNFTMVIEHQACQAYFN